MALVQKRAEKNLESGILALKRWWTQKYNLPGNHPLFEEQTQADLYQEMLEDMLFQRKEIKAQLEGDETPITERSNLWKRLRALNRALGIENASESEDPLADEWERDLAEGRVPDLNKQI